MATTQGPTGRGPLRWAGAGAAAVLLAAAGCIPVGWLPDSSGFVYTGGREFDRLFHYDLATGKRRVLVDRLPAHTPAVAVSPDGKRVAVARLRRGTDPARPETMQVLLYDLQGKLVHRSPEFEWGANRRRGEEDHPNTGVFWAAGVLLVQDFDEPGRTGIYDLVQDAMRRVLDGTPAAYGGTPVRPDGKGFLMVGAVPPAVPEPELFFVDWQGGKQRIPVKGAVKGPDDHPDAVSGLLLFPWKGTSDWQGHVARVSSGRVRIRVDTEKRTAIVDEPPREEATAGGKKLRQQFAFARGGIRLRVVVAERTKADPPRDEDVLLHLEMVRPGDAKAKLLLEVRNGSLCFSPSPDGKWVAVRSGSDAARTDDVLLVSETGDVREVPGDRKE